MVYNKASPSSYSLFFGGKIGGLRCLDVTPSAPPRKSQRDFAHGKQKAGGAKECRI